MEEREAAPSKFVDPYFDMTSEEKSKLIILLQEKISELMSQLSELSAKITTLTEIQERMTENQTKMTENQVKLSAALMEANSKIAELLSLNKEKDQIIKSLTEQKKLNLKNLYGSKSLKGKGKKSDASDCSREQDKDDFDGTSESLSQTEQPSSDAPTSDSPSSDTSDREKEIRLYRQGVKYRKMGADKTVMHASDKSRLPQGAEFMKYVTRYSYEQVVILQEHEYQLIRYKLNGKIYEGYFPADGSMEVIDRIPGTKSSSNLLAHLSFNRFVLDTPLYREVQRLKDEKMMVTRMTLTNWLYKGSLLLTPIVEYLKSIAIEKDAIVNCDETWCRVKVRDKYQKRYIWCLVNREAKIVIYCYEDGSRGRDALLNILGDAELTALQSDGYNVYMYLDKEMIDIDHICCLAHAKAKFNYAYEQGGDADAKYILDLIGKLYEFEAAYKAAGLKPEEITIARNSLRTKEIVVMLRSKLNALEADEQTPRGEMMIKAIRYLKTFWEQIFTYLKDGRYSIDNSVAEQYIRPLAGERKNSLFFGSHKMAKASAVYHTVISTCRMHGISALEYLKEFFKAIVHGRSDYENLLPMTIGLSTNKY